MIPSSSTAFAALADFRTAGGKADSHVYSDANIAGAGRQDIFVTDGTDTGTRSLLPYFGPLARQGDFAVLTTQDPPLVYFNGSTGVGGREELWQTDGTAAGTVQFTNNLNQSGGTRPTRITVAGGRVFFASGHGVYVLSTAAPADSTLLVSGNGAGRTFVQTNGQYGGGTPTELIPGFTGEVRVALADVTGDGVPDTVAAPGPGGARVVCHDGKTGAIVADFTAFENFAGGLYVSAGDLNGDGRAGVVVTGDGADAFSGPVANGLQVPATARQQRHGPGRIGRTD